MKVLGSVLPGLLIGVRLWITRGLIRTWRIRSSRGFARDNRDRFLVEILVREAGVSEQRSEGLIEGDLRFEGGRDSAFDERRIEQHIRAGFAGNGAQ